MTPPDASPPTSPDLPRRPNGPQAYYPTDGPPNMRAANLTER